MGASKGRCRGQNRTGNTEGTGEDMDYFLATSRGAPFHFEQPTNGELMARIHANRNREVFRTHPGQRRPDLRA